MVPRILSRAKRLKIIGPGRNLVDTTYIDNAVDAHLLAAQGLLANRRLSGNIYFVSQDEPINLWQMINAILHAGGLPPVKSSVPVWQARLAGALCEFVFHLLRIKSEPPMTRFLAAELATAHYFNINAIKRDLGYRPQIDTGEGLKRLQQWLRTQA